MVNQFLWRAESWIPWHVSKIQNQKSFFKKKKIISSFHIPLRVPRLYTFQKHDNHATLRGLEDQTFRVIYV